MPLIREFSRSLGPALAILLTALAVMSVKADAANIVAETQAAPSPHPIGAVL